MSRKEIIRLFYDQVMRKENLDFAEKYIKYDYKQHNPLAEDGREGLLAHVKELNEQFPDRTIEFVHLFEDGDYVMTHIHFILVPDTEGVMGMDIFRFEGEQIAEHWDVIQQIPEESANDNGMR